MKKKKEKPKALFLLEKRTKFKLDCLKKVFNVYIPKTGSEALKLLEDHKFCVIFLGIMIPQGRGFPKVPQYRTGIRVIQKIRAASSINENSFLIVLSASAEPNVIEYAEYWADIYLESVVGERSMKRLLDIFC